MTKKKLILGSATTFHDLRKFANTFEHLLNLGGFKFTVSKRSDQWVYNLLDLVEDTEVELVFAASPVFDATYKEFWFNQIGNEDDSIWKEEKKTLRMNSDTPIADAVASLNKLVA